MIYVDPLFATPITPRWPYPWACHLFGDDVEALHRFARRAGLKRAWFQPAGPGPDKPGIPHYDLTKGMRERVLLMGARELPLGPELLAKFRELREKASTAEGAESAEEGGE